MQPLPQKMAAFWDGRAQSFPSGRSEAHRARMLARLSHAPEAARPRAGLRCLDIGAGTGVFSVYAAELGARATALDVSPGMLEQLRAEAQGLDVEIVLADWADADPAARGWERAFDTVFAQMVPGFRSVEDFRRMEACCRGWCVFVGWGTKRRDPWLEAAFAAHGAPWAAPPGAVLALELLERLGRRPEPVWLPETWERSRPVEAVIRDAASPLAVRGAAPDKERLRALARDMCGGAGIVEDAADVELGVLCWEPGRSG